jgi:hypothetical protein
MHSVIRIYACCNELYAHSLPQESMVQGSAVQRVDESLRLRASGFQSSAFPLLGATLMALLAAVQIGTALFAKVSVFRFLV